MSLKTEPDDRRRFYEQHQRGETYAAIAVTAGVSLGCVRYWCRRLRDGGSCLSQYRRRPRGLLSQFHPLVRYGILRLRLAHPRWGVARIRYGLGQRPALQGQRLPGPAQIGRYLRQWPKVRHRLRTPKASQPAQPQAVAVHQRWQVDFKMGLALRDGSQVNLQTVRDPVGEVCIAARVTPAGSAGRHPARVTLRELQATLRCGFARWHTLPQEVQTDHEGVFVGNADTAFPSPFSLWLLGLGIRHLTIRPGQPTDNAEVERCHQTVCNYAIVGNEACDCAALQRTLDQALDELAFDLPSQAAGCAGQPPALAHPQLLQPAIRFAVEHEWALFDLQRVDAYLAEQSWPRIVGDTGQVTIGGQHQRYSVGRAYAGQMVQVRFDPADRTFVFCADALPHRELRRRKARHLDKAFLTGLPDPEGQAAPQQLSLFDLLQGVSC